MILEGKTEGIGKPRVRFCHECGRKLYQNHHMVVRFKDIDHDFIYHKDCAKLIGSGLDNKNRIAEWDDPNEVKFELHNKHLEE